VLPCLSDFPTTLSGGVDEPEAWAMHTDDLSTSIEATGDVFEPAGSSVQ
jgi:hypothetical protein